MTLYQRCRASGDTTESLDGCPRRTNTRVIKIRQASSSEIRPQKTGDGFTPPFPAISYHMWIHSGRVMQSYFPCTASIKTDTDAEHTFIHQLNKRSNRVIRYVLCGNETAII